MIEQKHLNTYRDLFIHRDDVFAQQTPKGAYFLRRAPVTDDVIRAHLAGHITAGWYALSPDNTTKWVVLDADREDGLEQLQHAWQMLSSRGVRSYLELSRRGGHSWTFLDPVSARVARRLILGAVPDLDGVEVFPKRDRLEASSRVGNLVRGPLGVHLLTGRRYPFVDPSTLEPLSESVAGTLECLSSTPRITVAQVGEQLAALLEETRSPAASATVSHSSDKPDRSRIERLNNRLGDLYGFISQYVELDTSGRGHCPFHLPDVHPSFVVDRQRGFWICFHEVNPKTGHYLGGDAVAFYRRLKGLSYRETVQELETLLATKD